MCCVFFFFKQKTAYEMRISDWSSDVCSSDLPLERGRAVLGLVELADGIAIPALGGGPPRGLLLIDELAELRGAARDVAALDLRLHHLEREILIGESRRLRLLIIGQRVRIFLLIEGDRPRTEDRRVGKE